MRNLHNDQDDQALTTSTHELVRGDGDPAHHQPRERPRGDETFSRVSNDVEELTALNDSAVCGNVEPISEREPRRERWRDWLRAGRIEDESMRDEDEA